MTGHRDFLLVELDLKVAFTIMCANGDNSWHSYDPNPSTMKGGAECSVGRNTAIQGDQLLDPENGFVSADDKLTVKVCLVCCYL